MLRITLEDTGNAIKMVLEGRVAGPWVEELDRVWTETEPRVGSKKLLVDLKNVTYADAAGKRALKQIFSHAGAELVASSLGIRDLVEEVLG